MKFEFEPDSGYRNEKKTTKETASNDKRFKIASGKSRPMSYGVWMK